MKYLKKFNESWFNPFSKDKHSGYESPHVKVYGDLSDDKVSLLKAIDMCIDKGIDLRDSSGEITDGADIWTISTSNGILAIKPDYRKGVVRVINLSDKDRLISTFNITKPEEISDKICDLF